MLEGVVARLLNRWLGKYVLDLDTENLNVGIFSGQVQLTDLRLKPEALYELDLPIEVKLGTIGKICIQIPWNALLNQPVVIHVEDVHILASPVIAGAPYDAEKDKRLIRAAKRKALADLDEDGDYIGGPNSFPEHLITSIINNLQIVVQNIHLRYEDSVSAPKPLVAGLCISSISAETTNNKWKACSTPKGSSTGYLLLKLESFSVYWNTSCQPQTWDWRTQYYIWRNMMTSSLQTFSMNNVDFDFLIKPMTCKIKFIINKSNGTRMLKLLVDIMLQDFTLQLSRDQYLSMCAVVESMQRMVISRQFLSMRPAEPVLKNVSGWWRYAHNALLQQRIRPYTWSKILTIRNHYRLYRDTYKRLLVNPNDTELKLDLQKYEDNLSLINIVIAREHAKKMLKIEQPDFNVKAQGMNDKGRSLWSMLPSPERGYLCQMIGYAETPSDTKSPYHTIEHKYNATIGNFSLSLMNNGREILAVTLTQVLASIETRPSVGTYKISGRAEGLVIEGASLEDHLVPLINAEHICNGSMSPNVVSIDYEHNGVAGNSKLWGSLEAIEAVFHMHAVIELLKFLEGSPLIVPGNITDKLNIVSDRVQKFFSEVLDRKVDVNLDIKIPYFVIPEYGCINKTGNFVIVDFGRLVIRTELAQPSENLEEATQMELEEQLYSRLHVDLFHMQLLFCDSSENWRDARKEIDTELHLISKLNMLVVFSSCIKPDYKLLTKNKLTVTIPSFKMNISERKITLLLAFSEHFHQMVLSNLVGCFVNKAATKVHWPHDLIVGHWSPRHLIHVTRSVSVASEGPENEPRRFSEVSELEAFVMGHSDPSIEPSEYSEDTSEAWARCVDLPGLEDNISPHNNIRSLTRIVLGELCIVLSRSSDRVDRAYLMLRTGKVCLDLALMDYGPALQLTVACISLTDKLHTNGSGQYLDLIHVPVPCEQDFITILYRKVKADCPDFRSHFHSVEKSLVADVGPVNVLIHRDAVRTLIKYLHYLWHKVEKYNSIVFDSFNKLRRSSMKLVRQRTLDPPVPPGAVKFSYSTRLTAVSVRLCDADCDIMEIRIAGLEGDFMFRANERLVLRAYLNSINVDHLAEVTLYTKQVLTVEEGKVFELKYVRHAPCLHRDSDIAPVHDDVTSDGSLKIHLSHIQVTFLYKLVLQLQHFFAPLVEPKIRQLIQNWLKGTVHKQIEAIKVSTAKLHLALNIHGPTILLPQKTASPNLIVIHTGELSVENFFKETSPGRTTIENILVKLEGTTILRAVMTLASSLEMQEVMLEPMSLRFDIKRSITCPRSANPCVAKVLSWEVDGILDFVKITLGQRDLHTLLAVYSDNISEGHFVEFSPDTVNSPLDAPTGTSEDDQVVKSLEAFFTQGEAKCKDITVKMNFEGMQVSLFSDCDEILSSPVRDLNQGLCKMEIGETLMSADVYTDGSLEAKLSVQNLFIDDIRPDSNPQNNKILQSHRSDTKNNSYQISVSRPPVIDISFHENQKGDRFIDAIVERVCLTLSVPFVINLSRFIFESLPCERKAEGGVINHGYVGDPNPVEEHMAPPDEKESQGLTIALRVCKPEFVFLVDVHSDKKIGFITKTELLIDYSRHAMRANFIVSISNFHVLFNAMKLIRMAEPYIVLHPCDFEFTKTYRVEDGVKATATVSSLQLHVCSDVVHALTDIMDDITCHLNPPELKNKPIFAYFDRPQEKTEEVDDMWSPKKLSQCYGTEPGAPHNTQDLELILNQTFIGSASNISIVLELEGIACTFPVMLIQSSVETTIHNWSRQLHGACEFHLQANYYNESIEKWEPFIEPVVCSENVYRPWELLVKIFQDKSSSMSNNYEQEKEVRHRGKSKDRANSGGSTSDDDDVSDDGMLFMRPLNPNMNDKAAPHLTTSLAAFLEDSDSETEDGTMEKLASAICDLFTGDWNESEDSDCGHSSATDQSGESDSEEKRKNNRAKVSNAHEISMDRQTTFVLIDSRDTLNVTLTSQSIKLFNDIMISYTNRSVNTPTATLDKSITLVNDVGPQSRVELLRKSEGENENVVVCSKTFEKLDSGPSSPSKSVDDFGDISTMESVDSASSGIRFHTMDSEWGHDKDIMACLQFPPMSTNSIYQLVNQESLRIQVPGFEPLSTVCPKKTWQKLLNLEPAFKTHKYHLLARHTMHRLGRTLVLSSPLRVRNETCYPLGLFYEHAVLVNLELEPVGEVMNPFETTMRIVVLEPQDEYNVPLHIAYHCKLFVQPANAESHHVSNSGLWWPELAADLGMARDIHCDPKADNDPSVFAFRARMEESNVCATQQSRIIPNYLIRILPPLCLQNCLPYSIDVKIPQIDQQMRIEAGDKISCYALSMHRTLKFLVELNYMGLLWTGTLNMTIDVDEKVLSMITDYDTEGGNKQLAINIKIDRNDCCNVYFYAPYWIINKTALPLQLKGCMSNVVYESQNEEALLFSYKRQMKQMVRIRAYQSSWSSEFCLDAVGTAGLIICKDRERNKRYPILLNVNLSQINPKLTKIVTLFPNFLVSNQTKKHLRFMEQNERTDLWLDLSTGQCIPFWPETSNMQMYIKFRDSKIVSQNFAIAQVHQTVLRMDKSSAVRVEVTGGGIKPFCIVFNDYIPGDAPVRVDNLCADLFLKVHQLNMGQVTLLSPYHSLLYTWDDPTAERTLLWNVYNNKGAGFPVDIHKDGCGEVKISFHTVKPGMGLTQASPQKAASSSSDSDSSESVKPALSKKTRTDKVVVYWLSYMEGVQRTLMLTQDHRVARKYQQKMCTEKCNWEMFLSLTSITVSLCTSNPVMKEFGLVSLIDSPAVWEVNIAHKWKMLTLELASWVEDKYKSQQKKCQLKDYVHIDFEKMFMLKPFYGELRRTYHPALWCQYRRSDTHRYHRLKINSLHVDNEISSHTSLKILSPVINGSVKSFEVPCLEFCSFKKHRACDETDIYKNVSLKVAEFFLAIDRMFIGQMVDMFSSWKTIKENTFEVRSDIALVHVPLSHIITQCSSKYRKAIIEHLQIHPISLQVGVSTDNLLTYKDIKFDSLVCEYIFNCLYASYNPIKHTKYSLPTFEIKNLTSDICHLIYEISNHYSSKLLQQFHVQVLGLDVLLNPYENKEPTIKNEAVDCDQMANEIDKTARCLLGHVHGPQYLISQITGEHLVQYSLETEHRRRRRFGLSYSSDFPESLMLTNKNFIIGVTLGFQGLFPNAVQGGSYNGAETFFRGSGKALASLMARSSGGVTDCVAVSLDAIRRAILMSERIVIRQRLTRYCDRHLGLKPFSLYKAMGQNLLKTFANGRYAESDVYWAHALLTCTGKTILLVTLQHIFLVENCRLWGPWDLEWYIDLDDVVSVPKMVEMELVINVRQEEGKQSRPDKHVLRGEPEILSWLRDKIEQALVISMEDKSWAANDN